MGSGLTTGLTTATHFEAWGQAVYGVKTPIPKLEPQGGLIVLFAISDIKRQWLGWYFFNTDKVPDMILLGTTHEVLGERAAFPSHFVKRKPMQVDELCGPIMASRGGWKKGHPPDVMRRAALTPGRHHPGSDIMDLDLSISSSPGYSREIDLLHPIHLYVKRKQDSDPLAKLRLGWVTFIMAEQFSYPTRHLNVTKRLRIFERNLTKPGGAIT